MHPFYTDFAERTSDRSPFTSQANCTFRDQFLQLNQLKWLHILAHRLPSSLTTRFSILAGKSQRRTVIKWSHHKLKLVYKIDTHQFPRMQRHNFLSTVKFRGNNLANICLKYVIHLPSVNKVSMPVSFGVHLSIQRLKIIIKKTASKRVRARTWVAWTKQRKSTDQAEKRKVRMCKMVRPASTIPASVASRRVATPSTQPMYSPMNGHTSNRHGVGLHL